MKIVSKECIRLSKAKDFMRRQMYLICLEYKKENRFDVLEKTIEKTGVFLILDDIDDIVSQKRPIYSAKANRDNLEDIFEALDEDDFCFFDEFENVSREDYEYLLVIKENGIPLDKALDTEDDGLNDFKFRVIRNAAKNYHVFDTFFYNSYEVIVLSQTRETREGDVRFFAKGEELPEGDLITLLGGIGDTFIVFSLIWEAAKRNKAKKRLTYILMSEQNFLWGGHDSFFFRTLPILIINNNETNNLFKTRRVDNLKDINIYFMKEETRGHIFALTAKTLGIEENIDPYIHKDEMEKILFNWLSEEDKEYVDSIITERTIGFQFFTGKKKDGMIISNNSRNWGEESVKEFLRLCRNNNIDVLVTNANPFDEDLDVKQLKHMNLPGYAYAISKLSLLVGIDSSAGHMASLFGVPSITIWGKQSPLDSFGKQISFRVLKKNYSLWSADGVIDSIKPEKVFEKVMDIRSGKLELEDRVITYDDTYNKFQMEIIGE